MSVCPGGFGASGQGQGGGAELTGAIAPDDQHATGHAAVAGLNRPERHHQIAGVGGVVLLGRELLQRDGLRTDPMGDPGFEVVGQG